MADRIPFRRRRSLHHITLLLAIVAGIAFVSCYPYVKEITEDHSAIADPRERWRAYGIYDYEYRMDGYSYHSDSVRWSAHIHIEKGKVDKYTRIFPSTPSHPDSINFRAGMPLPKLNFEGMFRDIEQYPKWDTVHYHVEYDPRFGFPNYVYVKLRRKRAHTYLDEPHQEYDTVGLRLRIREFQALELDY